MTDDFDDDRYDEERPKRRRRISCSDRMCGGSDCQTCFPGNNPCADEPEETEEEKE